MLKVRASGAFHPESTVNTVVNIAKTKDISFEDIREMNDDVIYRMFFPEKLHTEQMYQLPDYENIRMPELLESLNLCEETGHSIASTVTKFSNYHLLIIDEWLLDIPSEKEVKYLLEIFEKRYDQWPTVFCSQYKTSERHPRLGGGVIADAIMDRIVHNAEIINSGDRNMREFFSTKNPG